MHDLTTVITRADVVAFEKLVLAHPAHLTAKDFTTRHHIANGIYIRELHIPAGMIITGKIHKHPCWAILLKGKREMLMGNGKMELVVAPDIRWSPAGMKRVSRTLEDSIFITIHRTDKTNIEEIEQDLVCDSEEEYQDFLAAGEALLWLS